MRELKIGIAGVRGVVGDALTPQLIVNFASAFGTWCDGGIVVVGRDTRRSSPMLAAAVTAGLVSTGCQVIDLGVSPSPLISFSVRELGACGGISITGSHNDAKWNALKFMDSNGALLNALKIEELLNIFHASTFLLASWDRVRPLAGNATLPDRYVEHLLAAVDADLIRSKRFRVVVDFCNGSCAEMTSRLLDALGCQLLPINEAPSGEFAHSPAPNTGTMSELARRVPALEAHLGAAMNIDGNRIGFVTAEGTPLLEEYALPLVARAHLKQHPGKIVTDLSSSRMIERVAAEYGQKVLRTSVGESHVIDRGLSEGAVLAGEGSGSVAVLPTTTTFDALQTLGIVLQHIAASGESLRALAERLPRCYMRKNLLRCPPDEIHRLLEQFRSRYADLEPDYQDGVRVSWPDAWLHVRASNTESVLRIIVEAETAARADQVAEEALGFAEMSAYGPAGM